MPVSYPAQVPTSGITSLSWTNATASIISRSPFTFQGQSQNYPGAIRYAQISVDGLNREDAEDWVGFLDSLHGTKGTFLFGDPMAVTPMGTARGTALVNTVNQTSRDVITAKNVPTTGPASNFLKRGDWIQLGAGLNSRLYKVVSNVNKNNTTGITGSIHLWPAFRITPLIDDVITFENPKGLFRRSSGTFNYSEENGCKYSLSFDCEEVI